MDVYNPRTEIEFTNGYIPFFRVRYTSLREHSKTGTDAHADNDEGRHSYLLI